MFTFSDLHFKIQNLISNLLICLRECTVKYMLINDLGESLNCPNTILFTKGKTIAPFALSNLFRFTPQSIFSEINQLLQII